MTTGRDGGRPGMLRPLLLTFIPLFVAVDVVGLVAVYLGIALPFDGADRRRLIGEATMTAGAVGVGFLFAATPCCRSSA